MLQSVQIVSLSLVRFRDQTAWHQDLANFPAVFLNSCHGAESRTGTISWVGEWLNQEKDLYFLVSVTVVSFVLSIVFVNFLFLLLIIVATGGRFQTAWHQERASTRSRHQNCHRIPEYWSSCTDLSALNKNLNSLPLGKFYHSQHLHSVGNLLGLTGQSALRKAWRQAVQRVHI